MRRLLGFVLLLEAALAALATLRAVPSLPGYDAIANIVILARAAVGALQLAGGLMLVERKPPGPALARAALLASAVVTMLVVGLRLAPSDVYYWIRWQFVASYWAYVLVGIWILRR